jgi:hypothetical protein
VSRQHSINLYTVLVRFRDRRNQVLKHKEDGYALKAILAHDVLVHPDHPLRLEGKQGIELSIGESAKRTTLSSTHRRTLFQVPLKMARHACSSLLRRSNTFVTGCSQWVSQKSLSRSHIPTAFSRPRACKTTRLLFSRPAVTCAIL